MEIGHFVLDHVHSRGSFTRLRGPPHVTPKVNVPKRETPGTNAPAVGCAMMPLLRLQSIYGTASGYGLEC